MRKPLFLALGVLLTTGILVAQDHDNMSEKKVKDTVVLGADTKVGPELLKAGNYRVACDRVSITFTPVTGEQWGDQNSAKGPERKFPCKGKALAEASKRTEARVATRDGAPVLDSLLLKGSNIEHTFN